MKLIIKVRHQTIEVDIATLLSVIMNISKTESKRLIKQDGVKLFILKQ
jgi:hypothetical protein